MDADCVRPGRRPQYGVPAWNAWLFAGWLFLVACADERVQDRAAVERSDSAGVQLVRNSGPSAFTALTEVLRIGARDGGPPHLQFGDIRDIAVDANGRIHVADALSTTVRVFEAEGRFVKQLGGRGGGPGELDDIEEVWVTGDTVVAIGMMRAAFFAGDVSAETFLLLRPNGVRFSPAGTGPDGWRALELPVSFPSPDTMDVWHVDAPYRTYDPIADSVGDVVLTLRGPAMHSVGGTFAEPLFATTLRAGFDTRGRIYQVDPEGYVIHVYDAAGREVRRISRAYEPRAPSASDVDELRRFARDSVGHLPPDVRPRAVPALARSIDARAQLPLPEFVSTLGELLVSHDGSFWVERTDHGSLAARFLDQQLASYVGRSMPSTWDLFDHDGAYVATVDAPARFTPMAVRGGEVTGVLRDELDVEYVVTLRAGG
jgi:hypothetical protein